MEQTEQNKRGGTYDRPTKNQTTMKANVNHSGLAVSAGSVSAYAFNALSVSKVSVSPLRLTNAMKSPRRSKSAPTGTPNAVDSFSNVSNEGFMRPVDIPLIEGWETPIFAARSLRVIPFSLQSSFILSVSINIKYWLISVCAAKIHNY